MCGGVAKVKCLKSILRALHLMCHSCFILASVLCVEWDTLSLSFSYSFKILSSIPMAF